MLPGVSALLSEVGVGGVKTCSAVTSEQYNKRLSGGISVSPQCKLGRKINNDQPVWRPSPKHAIQPNLCWKAHLWLCNAVTHRVCLRRRAVQLSLFLHRWRQEGRCVRVPGERKLRNVNKKCRNNSILFPTSHIALHHSSKTWTEQECLKMNWWATCWSCLSPQQQGRGQTPGLFGHKACTPHTTYWLF